MNAFPILALSLLLSAPPVPPADDKPTTLVYPTRLHAPIRKATSFHLFLYVQNRIKVRDPQGVAVTRLTSWDDPDSEKDDDQLTAYGANSGQNVIIYNTSMTGMNAYGLHERGESALKNPMGVAATPWGDVYVADTGNNRIVRLFNPGKDLRYAGTVGNTAFAQPFDVAVSPDSTLFVSDTGNNRVVTIRGDTLHAVLVEAGQDTGAVWQPGGLAVTTSRDRWSYWRDEFLVVIDKNGQRIQKFSLEGAHLQSVTSSATGYAQTGFRFAAIDYYSNIWVTDFKNHCIHKFDRNLNYLTRFGSKGKGDYEFIEPRGIAINKRFGQVVVADKRSAQYYWVGTDIRNINARRDENGFIQLDYFLTERSLVTVEVKDRRGRVLGVPIKTGKRNSGVNSEKISGDWSLVPYRLTDGMKDYDASRISTLSKVPPGEYRIKITLSATYSSFSYFSKEEERRITVTAGTD